MTVAVAAGVLRTLHRMHRQLADLADQLAAGPRAVAARTRQVQAAEAKKAAAADELKKAKVAADQKQLQLKSAESKILDLERKLNACKTNREYQTLRDQIAADRMATQVLEDEIIEALERIDALKPAVPAADVEIDAARKGLAEAEAKMRAESGRLEAEVARVRADLVAAEKDLADDVREKYDRLVKQKAADAMAAVDGDTCGGCYQQITGNMLSEMMLGKIIACRSCGRLLYLPESTASA
ncbi:MAG: phospholipase [Planctomycetes bacterium]|nr:phospholipase [Planctomycetota bacterium]